MADDQKQKFDMILALRSAAWKSSDARRDAEWRVSLGLWTALGALIGILLSKGFEPNCAVRYGGVFFSILLVVLHYSFARGLQNANRYDRDLADHYDDFLEQEILLPAFPALIDPEWLELKERRKTRLKDNVFTNYSHRFQVLVTLSFSLCLIGVLFAK